MGLFTKQKKTDIKDKLKIIKGEMQGRGKLEVYTHNYI